MSDAAWTRSRLFAWREALLEFAYPPLGSRCSMATMRFVGLTLSMHMDAEGGSCFPSNTRLQRETGLSERSIRDGLRALEQGGWIVDVGVGPRGTRRRQASVPAPWAIHSPVDNPDLGGAPGAGEVVGGARGAGGGGHLVPPRTSGESDSFTATAREAVENPAQLEPPAPLLPVALDEALAEIGAGATLRLHADRLCREGFPTDVLVEAIAAAGTIDDTEASCRRFTATAMRLQVAGLGLGTHPGRT